MHQAQFAGFYLANHKGYYDEVGIEIDFFEGGKDIDLVENLLNGGADFSVVSPEELIINRANNNHIKAIAAIYRRSATTFVTMAESGIVRPQDFPNKKIALKGVSDFEMQFYALMKKTGIDISQIEIVEYDPEYKSFYRGEVDITPAYITGGLRKIYLKGYEGVNTIWPGNYGVDFYSDILITTDKIIEEDPELVESFLKASLKGWKEAIGNPDEAVTITLEYADIKDIELQEAMMNSQAPLIHTGEDEIGWMKDEDWSDMYIIMNEQGFIEKELDYKELYTLTFLDGIYKGEID